MEKPWHYVYLMLGYICYKLSKLYDFTIKIIHQGVQQHKLRRCSHILA